MVKKAVEPEPKNQPAGFSSVEPHNEWTTTGSNLYTYF